MAIDVRMPKLSDNMEEGIIIRWMKAPGDQVAKGEPLAEVETDKADVELEASESGVLYEIKVAEGQSAAVGAVIAVLAAPGDAAAPVDRSAERRQRSTASTDDAPARAGAAPAGAGGDGTAVRERPTARAASAAAGRPELSAPRPASAGRRPSAEPDEAPVEHGVRASPLAWRLADEAGVNLTSLRGSGPGGRILKRDVEASVGAGRASSSAARTAQGADREPVAAAEQGPSSGRRGRRDATPDQRVDGGAAAGAHLVEATRMRLAIAKRMAEAKRDIPHFYVSAEIDMSEAMHLRESIKRRDAMPGLTVTHLLLRALAIALVRHPRVNASWRDGAIELHDDVSIGIAVAVEDGLLVPVLHRAQTLTLGEIAARATALTDKARGGKFGGEELIGGTFSLSNVGMLDVEELVAVINPPQAAILAVGAVKDRPIVRDGQLAVAKTMRATLSCDHRVLNGVEGGRFLEELKGILENPVTLLLE
jgi:pyruvate dehydrogenase E2 component (dihydrolipoamide acetyltransferase)